MLRLTDARKEKEVGSIINKKCNFDAFGLDYHEYSGTIEVIVDGINTPRRKRERET